MSNAITSSPKGYPSSARSRGGSGGSSNLVTPRPINGSSARSGSFTAPGNPYPNGPGSFSSSLRSVMTTSAMSMSGVLGGAASEYGGDGNGLSPSSEQLMEDLNNKLQRAIKYKEGAENLLIVLDSKKKAKEAKEAEREYNNMKMEIDNLERKIAAVREKSELSNVTMLGLSDDEGGRLNGFELTGDISPAESPTVSLTDILRSLEETDCPPQHYIEKANELVALFKRHPNLKYELNWITFGMRIQRMLLSESKEVVAAGYRVTRYAITDLQSLKIIRGLHTDELVVLSLASKSNLEREQALKFVRAFLEIPGGVREIARSVVRAIVAIAEFNEDRLRGIAIETLAEVMTLDPEVVSSAGGVRVLTQVLADGPWEIADALSLAFLYLLDMPQSRKYVRAGHDLEIVFAAFTDTSSSPKAVSEDKLKSSARIISSMLKSWPGLLCLSMFNLRALRSLVDSLRVPSSIVRDVILELLFDVFRIKPPSWTPTYLAGRRLTTYGRVANLKSDTSGKPGKDDRSQGQLVDHYTSLVLATFVDAGLLEVLISLVKDNSDQAIVRKTTLLLGETLKLASQLLPSNYSARLQLLPDLFSTAAKLEVESRFTASSAVYQIDSLNRTLYRSLSPGQTHRGILEDEKRGARQVELKMKLNMTIDNQHFSNLLVDTGVVDKKGYVKWNWTVLNEVIQGPLLNAKRLDEAMKGTKFMKRLFSFYRPFKYRFCDIKNTKPNHRYVETGCALFKTLLQTNEGVKFLGENKILKQIAFCLEQLVRGAGSGTGTTEPLFSSARLHETLSWGYFSMLGVLSGDTKGLAMMEKWHMFSTFYHITDLQSRPDLSELFVRTMDFTLEGHPRIILSKVLTNGPKNVRLMATNHLRSLATPSSENITPRTSETAEWAIRLLITQLYDPDVEVCETAVRILEEACNSTQILEYVVKCRPALDHLGEIGAPLLLRFLSTSVGYHYLNELDYINREMDDWFHGRNDSYVLTVEASLARAFFTDDEPSRNRRDIVGSSHGISSSGMTSFPSTANLGNVPPHFYRELARTSEGCKLLKEKGHFEEFAMFIREHGREAEDPEIVTKVKGCLWAVGNIGSMPFGAPFLDEAEIVGEIVRIAEESEVLTLKGTAFFVLGLVAKTMQGLEILLENGWDGTTTTMGQPLGYCMPMGLKKLLSVEPWKHTRDETSDASRPALLSTIGTEDSVDTRILRTMSNLSNHIKEKAAAGELLKLKQSHPTRFSSPTLFKRAMMLLESFRYRFQVRRFILELFDRSVLEEIIVGAREPGEGEGEEMS
ncbi:hypothetical protein EX30DRAFT_220854 [Ascodesmis nigricans]|uniref:REM-1 domain-containing protein n=1 Tax=Ascodesmis nigricans TaxID=341454 RepID=A0A4S2N070_9PEZI|nr:hypothetical protein EX30DRAFT_220854 [Ascodesmis nigricans]